MRNEIQADTMPRLARVRRSAHVVNARRGDHTVLMDVARGAYFSLDEVGSLVWSLLESTTSANAIVERVAEEYNAPRERIEQDIISLLNALVAARLIATD